MTTPYSEVTPHRAALLQIWTPLPLQVSSVSLSPLRPSSVWMLKRYSISSILMTRRGEGRELSTLWLWLLFHNDPPLSMILSVDLFFRLCLLNLCRGHTSGFLPCGCHSAQVWMVIAQSCGSVIRAWEFSERVFPGEWWLWKCGLPFPC